MTRALVKRHLTMYLRDRWAVFFSFLSILIILGLFLLFLKDAFGLQQEGADYIKNAWILSGVLMVGTVTIPLGFLGLMVEDLEKKTLNDFYVAPIPRRTIVLSYLLSALIIGLVLSLINLIVGQMVLTITLGETLPFFTWLKLLGVIVLSTALFSSLFFFITAYIKTSNAKGTLSTLIGTLIGFLAGLYVPIGAMGETTRNILSSLPTMQAVSLFRIVYMDEAMTNVFGSSHPERTNLESFLGITLNIGDISFNTLGLVAIIIGWIALFLILSIRRLTHYKRQG